MLTADAPPDVSEGEVSYRTDGGMTFRVYFRCAANGNTVTVTPAHFARISHNPTGSPLAGMSTRSVHACSSC